MKETTTFPYGNRLISIPFQKTKMFAFELEKPDGE